ncbi:nucleotide-binding leucine-rich repeat (NLR)-like protein isoform X2 [Malus domestica]|uniref:nucleotide-binding leucine-rich repeat (NLR)-like protein isoform X2 n=1 Tax=Malus domestica TaxID=3750 RepID=UPI000498CDBE|nr:uncharacterized protein LOC103439890 isoform X2 [Malus domestica]
MNAGVRGIEKAATIDITALGYMAIGYWLYVKDGEPLLDSVLVHMGSMYSTLGKFEKSMSAYRRAVSNMENRYGNANEAISLYRKALEVIMSSNYMALDDSIMDKMRIDLAGLLHAVGRGKEGRELLEECLMITERYKGKEDPSSATHLINLATSHSRSKNYVEAERLLRASLQILAKTVGLMNNPSRFQCCTSQLHSTI